MKRIVLVLFLSLFFQFCEKEKPEAPTTNSRITITTPDPEAISYRGAILKGTLGATYGNRVKDYGHCWDTLSDPTMDKYKTSFGSGEMESDKGFTSELTNLQPGKNYHTRAYFVVADDTLYSDPATFTSLTPGIPELQIDTIRFDAITSIELQGHVMDIKDDSLTENGICWNTSGNPGLNDSVIVNKNNEGVFVFTMDELSLGTGYYFRAYAKNTFNTGFSEEKSITTETGLPEVVTREVTDITAVTANSGGEIPYNGGFPVTGKGVCWSTSPEPTVEDNKTTDDGQGSDAFVSQLIGLEVDSRYYVRAYATNSAGTGYGEPQTFTTKDGVIQLTTAAVSNITASLASCGGNISDDGGFPVTARGVCWNTSGTPDINDSKTLDGAGTGSFSSSITGLTAGAMYYARAYATNSFGTEYGQQEVFTAEVGQTSTFTDRRDNKTYKTIKLGNQWWMAENLAYLPSVSPSSAESFTEPVYYVYNYQGSSVSEAKATSNYDNYGALYNWPAAMSACPGGWHLPSDAEWKELEMHLGMSQSEADDSGWRGTNEGSKLAGNADLWDSGDLENNSEFEASGFSALPGGLRSIYGGDFDVIGSDGIWWSSSEDDSNNAWYRRLSYYGTDVGRDGINKEFGFSVRCAMD